MTTVTTAGDADVPAIVLVHGAGISRTMWAPQVHALEDEFRVVAPDLPGHGDRADERFGFEAAVDAVVAALDAETTGRAVVVGQSLGGYVAVALAARDPDAVAGLVLSGASADYRGLLGVQTRVAGLVAGAVGRLPPVASWFQRRSAARIEGLALAPSLAAAVVAGGISLSAYGDAARALAGRDLRTPLSGYGGPVLLLSGERDRLNTGAAAELAPRLADARVAVVPGAGHTVTLEQPATVTAALRAFARDALG